MARYLDEYNGRGSFGVHETEKELGAILTRKTELHDWLVEHDPAVMN